MKKKITVSKYEDSDFKSIGEALESVPVSNSDWIEIEIKKGIYYEKLFIEKPFIRLIGEDLNNTKIIFNDFAKKEFSDGRRYGTFNSYTLFIGGDNFIAENLCIENSAGVGDVVGQAIAAYVDADRVVFRNCRLMGSQDTLFVGPLPPESLIPGGFARPREFAQRKIGRQYYESCFIKGDIDFIFGSGIAVFNECEIFSINRNKEINGYITAASTPEGEKFGFTFINCVLTGDALAQTVYLGRPWRDFAKTVFIKCRMEDHIKIEGWHDWDKKQARKTIFFAEYNNYGAGSITGSRESWVKILTGDEAGKYTVKNILSGKDGWDPES